MHHGSGIKHLPPPWNIFLLFCFMLVLAIIHGFSGAAENDFFPGNLFHFNLAVGHHMSEIVSCQFKKSVK